MANQSHDVAAGCHLHCVRGIVCAAPTSPEQLRCTKTGGKMFLERLYYEVKLMGKRIILTPVLVMVGFALLAGLLHFLKVAPARALSAGLEMILPLMAGVVTAAITS